MGWTYQGRPIGGRALPGYGDCSPPDLEPEPPEPFNPREDTKRPWLLDAGYQWDEPTGEWDIVVSIKTRTCQRDHADGVVKVGDVYTETISRSVCDETGESKHYKQKRVIKSAQGEG